MTRDPLNAFVPGARVMVAPSAPGPLDGMTFAVKDLIDVAEAVTGGGVPDWAAARQPAPAHAPAVEMLLQAGATCIGKTVTDELAFSLEGRNGHYGTPVNPARPGCLPGGSSSGSASAVAGGLCDTALGTDTGGSVRVPGAFCNLYAMRPSHGAISLDGVTPFAPGYDTVGWLARDAATLARVGSVLLPGGDDTPITRISVAPDTFALCDPGHGAGLLAQARAWANAGDLRLFAEDWRAYHAAYAALQARDIRAALGTSLAAIRPTFSAEIAPRFAEALADTTDPSPHEALRTRATRHLRRMLPPGHAALIPTAPVACLPRDPDGATLGAFYPRALALGSLAGHAGAPQVQIPTPAGGLSLLGAPGSDHALLALAVRMVRTAA